MSIKNGKINEKRGFFTIKGIVYGKKIKSTTKYCGIKTSKKGCFYI